MNRREKSRHELALIASTGAYHTFDQWTRALLPFAQWNLVPGVGMDNFIWLTALSTSFTLLGTFFVARMIEVLGLRNSAMVSTALIILYQLVVCQFNNLYIYLILQSLLIFNNMQMIIDAAILNMESEDGDYKKRTRLITRIMIPQSIGYALGPYCALQMIFFVTPSLEISQALCGFLAILTLLPVIWNYFPDNPNSNLSLVPDLSGYFDVLKSDNVKLYAVLLMMVTGPYTAYDSLLRNSMASSAIRDPNNMHNLFLTLGLTTLFVNLILLPKLQTMISTQALLSGSFSVLAGSYLYLAVFHDLIHLFIGMPVQVAAATICIGELSSQLMGAIGKRKAGTAASVLRMSQLAAILLVPFVHGMIVPHHDVVSLCVMSAAISGGAVGLVKKFGSSMVFSSEYLPGFSAKFD
ncbi:MFS domain-containing protein [Caenorhabditis elegans]|uniref:MFS domain-containing protein n=2 Tax=Caenorhabditis elegans TaxID=6239 RepID=Q95XM7_CAEEL|nr:MFS domain-containing protein [Caenorhabditis elegans]CCD67979.1 MFS domain-containing protein [Caenorhabditis elegans]|eukprot:NP_490893.2 Uncharacterized protein CELE_Y71G12B.26 [Caenorhabditis elegans]